MMQTLNIPMNILKKYRKDKSMWELFAFAVCIKRLSGSSAIRPEVKSIRKIMNCGYDKAVRLIKGAQRCKELFIYSSKTNLLIARSFTRGKLEKHVYSARRRTFTAYSAFCFKYKFNKDEKLSHRKVATELRDALFIHAIEARSKSDDFNSVVRTKYSSRPTRARALNAKKMGRIGGCHHTTATRHLRKLEAQKHLYTHRFDFIPIADYYYGCPLTDDPRLLERRPFLRQGLLVVRDANEYKILPNGALVFTNVIFNHIKRHRNNESELDRKIGHCLR